MKYAALLAAAAALTLGACQESEEAATDAADTAAAAAPAAAEPAAAGAATFAAGQPPSTEFMVGIWGEGEECELPIDFQADGTLKDGPFDTWELTDGKLVLGGEVTLNLTVVDENTMESLLEGSTEPDTLKRCG